LFLGVLDRILLEMNKQNVQQKEIASFLCVKESAVAKWKMGVSKSYLKHISQIAEFLNVSTDYLLGNEQQEKSLPPLSDKDKEAIELFEKLSAHDKDFFIQLLKDRLK